MCVCYPECCRLCSSSSFPLLCLFLSNMKQHFCNDVDLIKYWSVYFSGDQWIEMSSNVVFVSAWQKHQWEETPPVFTSHLHVSCSARCLQLSEKDIWSSDQLINQLVSWLFLGSSKIKQETGVQMCWTFTDLSISCLNTSAGIWSITDYYLGWNILTLKFTFQ